MQKKLLKESKKNLKNDVLPVENLSEKTFIISVENVEDLLKRKKIIEAINPMENNVIGIVEKKSAIPKEFEDLSSRGALLKTYK